MHIAAPAPAIAQLGMLANWLQPAPPAPGGAPLGAAAPDGAPVADGAFGTIADCDGMTSAGLTDTAGIIPTRDGAFMSPTGLSVRLIAPVSIPFRSPSAAPPPPALSVGSASDAIDSLTGFGAEPTHPNNRSEAARMIVASVRFFIFIASWDCYRRAYRAS